MNWSVYPSTAFERYSSEWQSIIAEQYQNHPLLDARFVSATIRYFGLDDLQLAVERDQGEIRSLVLFEPGGSGTWNTFSASQLPISTFVTRYPGSLQHSVVSLLKHLPVPSLLFALLNYDQDYLGALPEYASDQTIVDYGTTIAISLVGDFADYTATRKGKLRNNVARYFKRGMTDVGDWRLKIITDPEHVAEGVATYADIESKGWKGRENTALRPDNDQGRFYTEVLSSFAQTGGARIYNLFLGNDVVSSRLAIVQQGLVVFLKTTYLEDFSRYAPGRLQLWLALENLFQDPGAEKVEFYTKANKDQLQWGTSQRPIIHVNYYPSRWHRDVLQVGRKLLKK